MVIRICTLIIFLWSSVMFAQDNSRLLIERRIGNLESLISQKFEQDQVALDLWLKDMKKKMPPVNDRFLKTYYSLGILHYKLYTLHSSGNERPEDLAHFQKARFYFNAIEHYEYNIDEVEDRLSKLDATRTERQNLLRKNYWRLILIYMSYQELALLKDSAGKEKITSPQRGPCFGGQFAQGNTFNEWTIDACVYTTSGNVGAKNPTRYFQRDVSSTGVYFKPTYWKMFANREAALGLGVPILFRRVDYTEPPGGSVEARRMLPIGLSLDGRWRMLTDVNFTSTTAVVDGSMLWSVGLVYEL